MNLSTKHGRRVIYCVLTGGYDTLPEPPPSDSANYVLFTDRPLPTDPRWEQVIIESSNLDVRRLSRAPKIKPHEYLADFDTSIYVDANVRVNVLLDTLFEAAEQSPSGFVVLRHEKRKSVCAEVRECIKTGKDNARVLRTQKKHYALDGFPDDMGLFTGGLIARRHNDPGVIAVSQLWWDQLCTFSYRDQISMPYVLWKLSMPPTIAPYNGLSQVATRVPHKSLALFNYSSGRGRVSFRRLFWNLVERVLFLVRGH